MSKGAEEFLKSLNLPTRKPRVSRVSRLRQNRRATKETKNENEKEESVKSTLGEHSKTRSREDKTNILLKRTLDKLSSTRGGNKNLQSDLRRFASRIGEDLPSNEQEKETSQNTTNTNTNTTTDTNKKETNDLGQKPKRKNTKDKKIDNILKFIELSRKNQDSKNINTNTNTDTTTTTTTKNLNINTNTTTTNTKPKELNTTSNQKNLPNTTSVDSNSDTTNKTITNNNLENKKKINQMTNKNEKIINTPKMEPKNDNNTTKIEPTKTTDKTEKNEQADKTEKIEKKEIETTAQTKPKILDKQQKSMDTRKTADKKSNQINQMRNNNSRVKPKSNLTENVKKQNYIRKQKTEIPQKIKKEKQIIIIKGFKIQSGPNSCPFLPFTGKEFVSPSFKGSIISKISSLKQNIQFTKDLYENENKGEYPKSYSFEKRFRNIRKPLDNRKKVINNLNTNRIRIESIKQDDSNDHNYPNKPQRDHSQQLIPTDKSIHVLPLQKSFSSPNNLINNGIQNEKTSPSKGTQQIPIKNKKLQEMLGISINDKTQKILLARKKQKAEEERILKEIEQKKIEEEKQREIEEEEKEKERKRKLEKESEIKQEDWIAYVFKKNPSILELRERIVPLTQEKSYSNLLSISKTEVRNNLSQEYMLQLIMQHFESLGHNESLNAIENISSIRYNRINEKKSRLKKILELGITSLDNIWNFTPPTNEINNTDTIDEEVVLTHDYVSLGNEDDNNMQQNSLNIYDEPPDSEENIKFTDNDQTKGIKCGTLNKLVQFLTPETDVEMDYISYRNTFLMTYQSFTTPKELLNKLIERYHVPRNYAKKFTDFKKKRHLIQVRIGTVLKKWIENHFSDFNERLLTQVTAFVDTFMFRDGHNVLAKSIRSTINKQLSENKVHKKTFLDLPPDPIYPKNIFSSDFSLLDLDPVEFARQETLIEHDIYTKIRPPELLNQAWSKEKTKHRSPNVLALIQRFNSLSGWVTSTILLFNKIRKRSKLINKFIKVAEHMKNLNNFNGLMAIIAGLDNSAIFRLKHTWDEVSKQLKDKFVALKEIMKSSGSYSNYRQYLHSINPPCIPYLGVYLTDLTFKEDGNKDFIGNLINFTKRRLVYENIRELMQYQQSSYNLIEVHQCKVLLLQLQEVLNKDDCFSISLKYEPRGAQRSEIK
ncbi:guanine nucleotide exchange factor [Anaeramoeba flamelloides]|uniref:Guanine nucleotide exchange factor n=1 Tax=Anaeramoeba flamelloides TaxID=1746091 RepID=A0AAV7YKI4_9EUKA|nr:guanine nucleotide exchange factor [Anaeramoeba flamelloides]